MFFLATICYTEFHNLNSDNVIKEEIEKQKELHQFLENNAVIETAPAGSMSLLLIKCLILSILIYFSIPVLCLIATHNIDVIKEVNIIPNSIVYFIFFKLYIVIDILTELLISNKKLSNQF